MDCLNENVFCKMLDYKYDERIRKYHIFCKNREDLDIVIVDFGNLPKFIKQPVWCKNNY